MNQTLLLLAGFFALVLIVLVGSLPRQMQSFSNDPTSEIKRAGYWQTRTAVKVGTLLSAIGLAAMLLVLMIENY